MATVDEDERDSREYRDTVEENAVLEPGVVADVMGHDAGERERECTVTEPGMQAGGRRPFRNSRFPEAPFEGGAFANGRIGVEEAAMDGFDDIAAAVGLGEHRIVKAPPLRGEPGGEASSKDPVELSAQTGGDAEEDEPGDTVCMTLRVCERERATPGSAEEEPTLDCQAILEPLEVGDQMMGGVGG